MWPKGHGADPAGAFGSAPLGRHILVPKTLRKRCPRNPTTAVFCLSENRCSEYTDLRNTLLPGPAWNPEGGPITGGAGWWRAAAIGGIRPHYLIFWEKQKSRPRGGRGG